MRLKDKTAVVSGAAGNIGAATVRRFVDEGARVLMVDRREAELAAMRDAMIAEQPARAQRLDTCAADVTRGDDTRRYLDAAVARWGPIHALFANAGIEGPVVPTAEYDDDEFDRVMAVNTRGVFLAIKYAESRMADGGAIVATSSVMGLRGTTSTIGYAASKHAVVGLMRSAAKTMGARGIRVNTVHPGMVDSDMLRRIIGRVEARGQKHLSGSYLDTVPIKAYVQPVDVANAVLFLASDESRLITGQTLAIDAGWLL